MSKIIIGEIEIRGRIKTPALLKSARILKRVLEKICRHSDFSGKSPVKSGIKNLPESVLLVVVVVIAIIIIIIIIIIIKRLLYEWQPGFLAAEAAAVLTLCFSSC